MKETRHNIHLTPRERRRLLVGALRRPFNLTVLAAGGALFAASLALWILPLTLLTYALLVLLTTRDPLFRNRALEVSSSPAEELSPERKATWLPRGETRIRVEKALISYREILGELKNADELAADTLSDAPEKLHAAAHSLVEAAHRREKAAREIERLISERGDTPDNDLPARGLKRELERAEREISALSNSLGTLRARVARLSVGQSRHREAQKQIYGDLKELDARTEALNSLLPRSRGAPDN